MSRTPNLDAVLAELAGLPFLAEPVAAMRDATYDSFAERHIARLSEYLTSTDRKLSDAVEAFVEMTFDVMKLQQEFYATGKFSMDIHGHDLYGDEDLMGRRYLQGLYLAQALWPNHYSKIGFFQREVVAKAGAGVRVLDVGCGPGTYGLTIGRAVECADLALLDISPLSLPLVEGLAAVDPPMREDSFRVFVEDFQEPSFEGAFDVIIFSEIVEHLPDPEQGMARLAELLADDGVVFFSTATNSAFYDHTIVFSDLNEIRQLLDRHGFVADVEHTTVAMPGPEGEDRDVVDYSAVLRSA